MRFILWSECQCNPQMFFYVNSTFVISGSNRILQTGEAWVQLSVLCSRGLCSSYTTPSGEFSNYQYLNLWSVSVCCPMKHCLPNITGCTGQLKGRWWPFCSWDRAMLPNCMGFSETAVEGQLKFGAKQGHQRPCSFSWDLCSKRKFILRRLGHQGLRKDHDSTIHLWYAWTVYCRKLPLMPSCSMPTLKQCREKVRNLMTYWKTMKVPCFRLSNAESAEEAQPSLSWRLSGM